MSDPLPNPIQLKILRLEGQLRDRQVKYDREKALLGGISGGAEYQIEQNLERLESDISRLTDEVTAAQTQLNGEHIVAVIRYLEDYWNTERQTCEQAFRRSLPPNSWAIEAETPATIAGIVNTLAKSGQDSDCLYTPLAIFVGKLLRQNSLYILGLREWLAVEIAPLSELESDDVDRCLAVAGDYPARSGGAISCLLIRVTYDAQKSTQANQRRYRIQGWYIENIEDYRCHYGEATNVYLPGDSPDSPFTFLSDGLETHVRELIDGCLDRGWEWPESLHVFLPPELMGQPIDSWSDRSPEHGSTLTLGTEHQNGVFIRCDDRLTNRRLRRSDWEKRWCFLQQQCSETNNRFFLSMDESSCNAIERQLRDRKKRIFGLLLTCTPHRPASSFFNLLSRSPIPAALWLRQELAGRACEEVLNGLLDAGRLEDIPETIFEKRLDANDPIGQHVSLVWDDPHLLPPDFQRLTTA